MELLRRLVLARGNIHDAQMSALCSFAVSTVASRSSAAATRAVRISLIAFVDGVEQERHDKLLVDVLVGEIHVVVNNISKRHSPLPLLSVKLESIIVGASVFTKGKLKHTPVIVVRSCTEETHKFINAH